MPLLRYREGKLLEIIGDFNIEQRTAFAASVSERLLPTVKRFSEKTGDSRYFQSRSILDGLWLDLKGSHSTSLQKQKEIDLCLSIIPPEDMADWIPEQPYAENALTALAYALMTRKDGLAQTTAWTARCAYDSVDYLAIQNKCLGIIRKRDEEDILCEPVVQAELAKQTQDLLDLKQSKSDIETVARILKTRSQKQPTLPISES
jgi:uncharacterized protein YjaG (DUF416 family)